MSKNKKGSIGELIIFVFAVVVVAMVFMMIYSQQETTAGVIKIDIWKNSGSLLTAALINSQSCLGTGKSGVVSWEMVDGVSTSTNREITNDCISKPPFIWYFVLKDNTNSNDANKGVSEMATSGEGTTTYYCCKMSYELISTRWGERCDRVQKGLLGFLEVAKEETVNKDECDDNCRDVNSPECTNSCDKLCDAKGGSSKMEEGNTYCKCSNSFATTPVLIETSSGDIHKGELRTYVGSVDFEIVVEHTPLTSTYNAKVNNLGSIKTSYFYTAEGEFIAGPGHTSGYTGYGSRMGGTFEVQPGGEDTLFNGYDDIEKTYFIPSSITVYPNVQTSYVKTWKSK